MRLLADFHTHSKYSRFFHGKNSIEEMVHAANEIGLKEIAITDHGFKHICSTSKQKLMKARRIVDEINEWSATKVFLGVEADIISEDGTLDVDDETIEYLDVLIIGYHKWIKTDIASFFGKQPSGSVGIKRVTNAYLNALERYPVFAISHLDSVLTSDLYQIGCVCRDKDVFVEINNRHTNWNQKQVDDLLASGCMFIVSSDAHRREDVGDVDHAFSLIRKYNIPSELVANVEFLEEEKSETGRALDNFYSLYKEKVKKNEQLAQQKIKKETTEFTNKLSPEMEEALSKIAKEKGLNYKESNEDDSQYENLTFEEFYKQYEERFLRGTGEVDSNNALNEFDLQNSKLESIDEIQKDDELETTSETEIDADNSIEEQNGVNETFVSEPASNLQEMDYKKPEPEANNFNFADRLEQVAKDGKSANLQALDMENKTEQNVEDSGFGGGLVDRLSNVSSNDAVSQKQSFESKNLSHEQSFTSNNSKKNGFSLNITALENGEEVKTIEGQGKVVQKNRKDDIASFVQFALNDGDVKKVETIVKPQTATSSSKNGREQVSLNDNNKTKLAKKRVIGFDPLGALGSETNNEDNKN